MKRRIAFYSILFYAAMCCGLAHAQDQLILTLPDGQLTGLIEQTCLWGVPGVWVHCDNDENGGHKTEQEKLTWMLTKLLQVRSMGRMQSLQDIGMTVEVRHD